MAFVLEGPAQTVVCEGAPDEPPQNDLDIACNRIAAASRRLAAAKNLLGDKAWREENPGAAEMILDSFGSNSRAFLAGALQEAEEAEEDAGWPTANDIDAEPDVWPAWANLVAYPGRNVIVGGPGKSGKTMAAAAAAVGVVRGRDWLDGGEFEPGRVLWLCAPNESDEQAVRAYLDACGAGRGDRDRVCIFEMDLARMLRKVRRDPPDPERPFKMLVVDSMAGMTSRAFPDMDAPENNPISVRRMAETLEDLRSALGPQCGSFSIHHPTKDGKTLRGTGAWNDAFDALAIFDRNGGNREFDYKGSRRGGPEGVHTVRQAGREGARRYERVGGPRKSRKNARPEARRWDDAMLKAVSEQPGGQTHTEAKHAACGFMNRDPKGRNLADARDALNRLAEAEQITVVGNLRGQRSQAARIYPVNTG